MARLTRRGVLGGCVAAVVAGTSAIATAHPSEAVPAVRDPDAALLALCARFLTLQATIDASYEREAERYHAMKGRGALYKQLSALEKEREAERAPYEAEQRPLLDQIGQLAAGTLAGQQARARVLMGWYGLGKGDEHSAVLEWHRLAPLFRDLLGESV